MRRLRLAGLNAALIPAIFASAICQITQRPQALPAPGRIGNVICVSDPAQSYALYLPSAYNPVRSWPIIYFFDPGGKGGRPLQLYKELAEKYGFIFVGSNNSRNFSTDQAHSVNAMWVDTHVRLNLDERRMYASGFSGGARVAGAMAVHCANCRIAGVISHGAGYPGGTTESNSRFPYYFAVGNRDFNWPEVMAIRRAREQHKVPCRVREYSGTHQWAPNPVMEDAIQWMQLKAMQAGVLPPNRQFIDGYFQSMQAEAEDAVKRNDVLGQYYAYSSLSSDFSPFESVDVAERNLASLKRSSELRKALKQEREQMDEQLGLEAEISDKIKVYLDGTSSDPLRLRTEILQAVARLQREAENSTPQSRSLIFGRALDDMWVMGMEDGQQELEARHFEKAEACFELMQQIRTDPWPALLLAETHAAAGNKRQALLDLEEAVRRGLKDADAIESDPRLQVLKSDSEFQKLLAGLKHD
jgi:dienelactone hydrolase